MRIIIEIEDGVVRATQSAAGTSHIKAEAAPGEAPMNAGGPPADLLALLGDRPGAARIASPSAGAAAPSAPALDAGPPPAALLAELGAA